MEELVKKAEVNKSVFLPEGKYEWVKFEESNYGNGYRFSWSAKLRGRNDYWSTVFPYGKTSSEIGIFKTLAGAKRNFLKRLAQ